MGPVYPKLTQKPANRRPRTSKVSIMMKTVRKNSNPGRALALLAAGALSWGAIQPVSAQLDFRPARLTSQPAPEVKRVALDRGRSDFQVTEKGSDYQVRERVVVVTDEQGRTREEVRSLVELGSNLNYWDPTLGDWARAEAVIEPTRGGAIARKGAQQVKFPRRLNSRGGVQIRNPDGQELQANVLGLVYRHERSGRQVSIARVKQSQGELLPPNQVLYRDAFDGVQADVLYEYRLLGVVQDVILREKLPSPSEFGFASNEGVTLEVVTEWLTDANVEVTDRTVGQRLPRAGREVKDQNIRIGVMEFGNGIGFPTQTDQPLVDSFDVKKRWETRGNRKLLYEAIDLPTVANLLAQLPARAGRPVGRPGNNNAGVASEELPAPALAAADRNAAPLAVGTDDVKSRPGLTIDYLVEITSSSGQWNRHFASGVTYWLKETIALRGNTVFEGGAVIKLADGRITYTKDGSVEFRSTPYNPVIFTSETDDSVGIATGVGSGTPIIATGAIGFYTEDKAQVLVENAVFRYLNTAIFFRHHWGHRVRNVRVSHVNTAVAAADNVSGVTWVENALFDTFGTGLSNLFADFAAANLTAHNGDLLAPLAGAELRNSLIVDVTTLYSFIGDTEAHNVVLPSGTSVFQSRGGGNFYLANNDHRDKGTDQIHPALKYQLERSTTHPPTIKEGEEITTNTTWAPHVARDDDGLFDLGYHYPAVDYLVDDMDVKQQAVLTVEPGTVLGEYGPYCIRVWDDAKVHARGTVTEPIIISWYGDLQDQVDANRVVSSSHHFFEPRDAVAGANQNEIILAFVHAYRGSYQTGGYYLIRSDANYAYGCDQISVSNCKLIGKVVDVMDLAGRQASIRNNLFKYGMLRVGREQTTDVYNNLFYVNAVHFNQGSNPDLWVIHDNLFVSSISGSSSSFTNATFSHNAFVSTSFRLGGALQTGDKTPSSLTFVTGPFGDYYLDSTVTSELANAGSRSAPDAGLFHYSTRWPDDLKEGISTVDIGLHYPSVQTGYGATGN